MLFLSAAFIISSCQKELSFEEGTARGTLKKASGDCNPISFAGTYKADTLLTAANFVEIQVDITQTGTYVIKTDTLNGYSFSATGIIAVEGLNTIRLLASGRPVAASLDIFTVKFDTTSCKINNVVTGSGGGGGAVAKFTLVGSPNTCTGAKQSNNFYANVPATPANTDTVYVNVSQAGTYQIDTGAPINGLQFFASGTLAVGNNVPIILKASGLPTAAGPNSFPLNTSSPNSVSNCGFSIVTQATPGPATYTINCATPAIQTGTFQTGTPLTTSSKITLSVTPSTTGIYSITTNVVNGVSFVGGGNFTSTTTQNVDLYANPVNNTPASAGTFIYTTIGGTVPCTNVSVAYTGGGGGEAVFFYTCSYSIITGTFQSGLALTSSDKISIPVAVGVSGSYSIISNTLNGVTFSGSGFLTAASGIQYIDLTATGQTPTNTIAESIRFDLTGTLSFACTITVPFTASVPATDYLRARIDGSNLRNFNTNLSATLSGSPGMYLLEISGDFSTFGRPLLSIDINSNNPIIATTYNQTSTTSSIYALYRDFESIGFEGVSGSGAPGPFTVQITSITTAPNRVKGTFFGTLQRTFSGSGTVTITEGEFSIPY